MAPKCGHLGSTCKTPLNLSPLILGNHNILSSINIPFDNVFPTIARDAASCGRHKSTTSPPASSSSQPPPPINESALPPATPPEEHQIDHDRSSLLDTALTYNASLPSESANLPSNSSSGMLADWLMSSSNGIAASEAPPLISHHDSRLVADEGVVVTPPSNLSMSSVERSPPSSLAPPQGQPIMMPPSTSQG